MNRAPRLNRRVLLAVTLAALSGGEITGTAAYAQARTVSPIQHIDHIMIRTDRPGDLFALFSTVLRLPVAWPLAQRGGVTSGAVSFGNVNIEAIMFPEQTSLPAATHLAGFGFKPITLSESLAELTGRGIPFGDPRPFVSTAPNGERMTLFTNVTLNPFSDSDLNGEQRRARIRRELAEIVRANENRLQRIVVSVVSLRRATDFLERTGLLGTASELEATFAPRKFTVSRFG